MEEGITQGSIKLYHTGDLHLGLTFHSRPYPNNVREAVVKERFKALEKMVDQANDYGCSLFVIAGDLFNKKTVSKSEVLRVTQILDRFSGDCIAILPGNHDYFDGVGDLWKNVSDNAPDNTLILMESRPYELNEYGLDMVLYPAPCDAKHSPDHRVGWIANLSQRPDARWHIGVAHGTIEGISPDFDSSYFPVNIKTLEETGLDLWLFGHTHVPYPQQKEIRGHLFQYCGTPEPDGFRCLSQGQAWLTTLNDEIGEIISEAVETGTYLFNECSWEVRSLEELRQYKNKLLEHSPESQLVKLTISGLLSEEDYESRHDILQEIKGNVFYLELNDDDLKIEVTIELISREFTEGSFPAQLLTRLCQNPSDGDALQKAYQMIQEVRLR